MAIGAGSSFTSRLLASSAEKPADPARVRDVDVVALDEFLRRHDVPVIDFLKIDTEGSDLDVLHGGHRALAARRVRLIQVEASMNPENSLHFGLQRFIDCLCPHDLLLFGLYEQVHE